MSTLSISTSQISIYGSPRRKKKREGGPATSALQAQTPQICVWFQCDPSQNETQLRIALVTVPNLPSIKNLGIESSATRTEPNRAHVSFYTTDDTMDA